MMEYVLRFVAGGVVVSLFAILGDVLRPKSFAGLFGAAPSVALVTLSIAIWRHGANYAALEARTMMFGAVALVIFSIVVCHLIIRFRLSALPATSLAFFAWIAVALGLESIIGGGVGW